MIHDPRSAKEFCSLPEKDINQLSLANQAITFTPEPGMLMMTNAWVPHTFTRNKSKKDKRKRLMDDLRGLQMEIR